MDSHVQFAFFSNCNAVEANCTNYLHTYINSGMYTERVSKVVISRRDSIHFRLVDKDKFEYVASITVTYSTGSIRFSEILAITLQVFFTHFW